MSDAVFNQAIVIDNGSGLLKSGFAGDERPRSVFPNYIASPKHPRVMAGALEGEFFVGPRAMEHRGLMTVRYPMEHGIVMNWTDMETVWKYVYSKEQLDAQPEEHPVLLTEAPLNPKGNREKMAEVFFESFRVPAFFVSMQAVLSLYSSKKTTGVVLDCGDGVTHAVPVYEGFALPHSVVQVELAGRDITHHLQLLLRKEGYRFQTSSEFEIVKMIKEKACYVAPRVTTEKEVQAIESKRFVLPDGIDVEIGRSRYLAPEILFKPEITGKEHMGIQEVLASAIQKSDLDLRSVFYQNIILSGGSTMFHGFGDRFVAELASILPEGLKIKVFAPHHRLYSTWIGGSILASLNAFRKMWISKHEYEEFGPISVHKTF